MIFKYFFVAMLGIVFYKMVFPKKQIETPEKDKRREEEYTDFEEIDD